MDYKDEILHVLAEVGDEGLTLKKIAKHVYNCNSSLFETPDFDKLYSDLAQYLSKQAKMSDGIVKRVGDRGIYALNQRWAGCRKMMFDFTNDEESIDAVEEEKPSSVEQSLFLFDDFD